MTNAKYGNKKIKNAWAFYDWANSVYPLVITTAIFPLFYENYAVHETLLSDETEISVVYFFGWEIMNTALVSIVLQVTFCCCVFSSIVMRNSRFCR